MPDWDAQRYHRISQPQFDWGQRIIARLDPRRGEHILDLGCGTGRVTATLASTAPDLGVVGLDRSGAMLAVARAGTASADGSSRPGATKMAFVQGDGAALPFLPVFDAVFSAATLHWIQDHPAVFSSVLTVLKPGGRFVAQCGGRGNLDRLYTRAARLMSDSRFQQHFSGWTDPWRFEDAETTRDELLRAGFADAQAWLEDAPVDLGNREAFAEFVSCVCIRHHLERIPVGRREEFVSALTEPFTADPVPFRLDYQRLNIAARKARA